MDRESNMELVENNPPAKVEEQAVDETTDSEGAEVEPQPSTEDVEVEAEEVLYETPDGRKVNAETLQKEWKENFLPEFTRKSQRLAEIEREREINKSPQKDEPDWKKQDFVPKTYAEIIDIAKQEAINDIKRAEAERIQKEEEITQSIDREVANLKAIDPKLDESALFAHANKYGFQDLKAAHTNMLDMRKVSEQVEQRTVKNLKKREADPISAGNNSNIIEDDGYDPLNMSRYESASDFLAAFKGKK